MFEIIVMSVILFLFAASFYRPLALSLRILLPVKSAASHFALASNPPAKAHSETYSYLSYLKSEIEADLFPRPTDSVLRRHYDTLVAVELENRLALMSE